MGWQEEEKLCILQRNSSAQEYLQLLTLGALEGNTRDLPDHPTKQLASLIPPVPEFPITFGHKGTVKFQQIFERNLQHKTQRPNNQEKDTQKKQMIPRDKENVNINDNILRKDGDGTEFMRHK